MEIQPVAYILSRWRFVLVALAAALAVAVCGTLAIPKKYTATTRLFIEPPAGSDQRVAVAVSPIYLDSLRTYETFASSDTLFLQAVERFGLRRGAAAIDKLKRSILKAEVPRNTKILEIRCTLDDAKKAHEVALYIAQATVKLNSDLSTDSEREAVGEGEKAVTAASARLDAAQRAWNRCPDQTTSETLRSQIASDEELRQVLQRQSVEFEIQGDSARAASYRDRAAALDKQIAAKRSVLAESSARLETLDNELTAARRAAASAESKAQEARSSGGYHGEKLRIIDPGVVPERPSSPDLLLNLLIAGLAAAVLSTGFLLLSATSETARWAPEEPRARVAVRRD